MAYTIKKGSNYFNTVTWTGDGTSSRSITGLGFQPDLVWWKNRTTAKWHQLFDSVRGADKALSSNATDAEDAAGGYGGEGSVTSFDSDGFTLQGGVGNNESSSGIVGWAWRGSDSAAVTNNDGDITSTVSANPSSGFSVVTYTGNGTGGSTVGHGLGSTPKMIIVKKRSAAGDNWAVYHTSLGANAVIFLNSGDAYTSVSGKWGTPNSTTFGINAAVDINENNATYVAYCWAEVEGFSKFGSYTGNSSTDGPFIYTGFRPAWFMVKVASGFTNNWTIYDSATTTYNPDDTYLLANSSGAEVTANAIDFLSNGIKLRNSSQAENNSSGTYIYMAFAETPFKYANAR